jgi:hypothetical protein
MLPLLLHMMPFLHIIIPSLYHCILCSLYSYKDVVTDALDRGLWYVSLISHELLAYLCMFKATIWEK